MYELIKCLVMVVASLIIIGFAAALLAIIKWEENHIDKD